MMMMIVIIKEGSSITISYPKQKILLRLYELFSGFQIERYSSKRCALNARLKSLACKLAFKAEACLNSN
jgi:hypothetical protein